MTSKPVKNILIFDDDRDYRALLKTYMQKYIEGASVEEYDPVARGVPGEEFDWAAYDVIILDYYLCIYGVTGLDLLHKNRNRPGFPAVIMLTGAADQDIAVSALDSGVSAFLRKEKLDKMELVEAIRSAVTGHEERRREQDHLEKAGQSFDKAGFYRRLAKTGSRGEPDHVFLYLDIDGYPVHVEQHDVIVSANLLRHIAKLAFRFFQERRNITNITRISDSSLGLLIDHPGTRGELEKIMQELCDYLDKHVFTYRGRDIPYSVSIGLQVLRQDMGDHGEIVGQLKQARNIARKMAGNTFCIYDESEHGDIVDSDITDLGAVHTGNHDLRIEQEELDSNSREVMKAFREGRAIKWFHPVVSTSAKQDGDAQVIMKMEVGIVDAEGNTVEPDRLLQMVGPGPVRQYIDRWKLKELLARITGNEKSGTNVVYMLEVGESWFADVSLYKWLRDLLGKLEAMQPGRHLVLSVPQDVLEKNMTRAVALLTALGKTHKFRFALGGINPGQLPAWRTPARFEFGVVAAGEILENPAFSGNPALLLESIRMLKEQGMRLIVDEIGNSTMLTDVISFGADYVMGPFIDESQSEFRTMERIEAL